MKKLYKFTFNTVIYGEENEAAAIAETLCPSTATVDINYSPINSFEDFPYGWDESLSPIINDEGDYSFMSIAEIFDNSRPKDPSLLKEIKELKKRLTELEERL